MKIHIIIGFALLSVIVGGEEIKEDQAVFVSAKIISPKFEVQVYNLGDDGIQYVLIDGHARNFGIEFWDQEKIVGRRVYAADVNSDNLDGFGMDVRNIEGKTSLQLVLNLSELSTSDPDTKKIWAELSESGYFYCRVFFQSYSSAMYSVLVNNGKIEAERLR